MMINMIETIGTDETIIAVFPEFFGKDKSCNQIKVLLLNNRDGSLSIKAILQPHFNSQMNSLFSTFVEVHKTMRKEVTKFLLRQSFKKTKSKNKKCISCGCEILHGGYLKDSSLIVKHLFCSIDCVFKYMEVCEDY